MRIAVATDNNQVAAHFGHCQEFTLYDAQDGKVTAKTVVPSPAHQPGLLPRFLGEKCVNCIIAGGMGPSAQDLFAQQNIAVVVGASGPTDDVVKAYLSGDLSLGASACHH
ncbi:MAG: NifB/NifX family molybdenum-iron cluster-binding protein [bacterium]|jgi:predicted Fe-Mo cluster-binding NifX family protein